MYQRFLRNCCSQPQGTRWKWMQQVPLKRRCQRHIQKTVISQVTTVITRKLASSVLVHWFPVVCLVGKIKYKHVTPCANSSSSTAICASYWQFYSSYHANKSNVCFNADTNCATHVSLVTAAQLLQWFWFICCCDSHLVSCFGKRWTSLVILLTMCNRTILH
jgi:hypothetical protein